MNIMIDAPMWFQALALLAAKGVMLLGLLWLTMALMRGRSATLRHALWAVGLVGVLALPFISTQMQWAALPAWPAASEPVLKVESVQSAVQPAPSDPVAAVSAAPTVPNDSANIPRSTTGPESESVPLWFAALVMVWLWGAFLCFLPYIVGRAALWRLARQTSPLNDEAWQCALDDVRRTYGIRRPVRLLLSTQPIVPMTWGILRPILMLPASALEWDATRWRVVLEHECAHIRRWDALTDLLGLLARALHWFNPLAWVGVRRLYVEREAACDEAVLLSGIDPSTYAQHLVEVVRGLQRPRCATAAGLAMARSGNLEGRVTAILAAPRKRSTLVWPAVLVAAILIVILGGINFATIADARDSSYAIVIRLTENADEPIILDHIPASVATANLVEIKRGQLRSDWVYDVPLADVQDLKTLLANMKVGLVTLRPAESVKVQLVIDVMEALKEAGIEHVEVATVEQTPRRMGSLESDSSQGGLSRGVLGSQDPPAYTWIPPNQRQTTPFAEEPLDKKMRIMGIVFKMYSNESKGEKLPPRTAQPGGFYPQDDLLYPEYVTEPATIDFLKSLTDVRVCYTGYLVHDEASGQQYLKAFREGNQQLMANEDVPLPDGTRLMRLREGIERFLITDINDPNAGYKAASVSPILWTMPDDGKGGYVLFLDGHVEWVDMGSKFPMTEEFIAGLNEVMAPKKP